MYSEVIEQLMDLEDRAHRRVIACGKHSNPGARLNARKDEIAAGAALEALRTLIAEVKDLRAEAAEMRAHYGIPAGFEVKQVAFVPKVGA